ncbi:non-canonical purine NTP pyrophosphatase, RdgB/HAM1 family [Candidatus Gottesmanbacteria bacterium RIFCSPHIGHO2_02_FULL_39_14]|uniref:dITP/XTP pyrophosphatase n=2 Tax=Candidatus Gottesmaniibacteriota TaxID=1752720 RepID=A0A1F6A2I0_9BACT|nr:MAG: non-canonical purine NTP pyrophosphatase, RdgB/HAM1 family [Candidatus Gottesmanbacteria bacterium RBG_16_38_7b]OGG18537.1 MAG: non-canonical purine NTP pyrophosphatase, RdgB/HAM1 family [Candidatus Gottesmanbacteria bacterium RIFCSPHIGHO2_02_FULL_39_14]
MKKILLIATNNINKLKEIKEILRNIPFQIKSLTEVGFKDKITETGKSYHENARYKAQFVGKKTGLLTLAEDSGLEIDFLNGKPGIYSARYSAGSDRERINKVLKQLERIPEGKRSARFVCVAALFNPQTNKTIFFEGESKGFITDKPLGKSGFGYDPIFFNFDLEKTNAQVSLEEKNRVSHRTRALLKANKFLINIQNL